MHLLDTPGSAEGPDVPDDGDLATTAGRHQAAATRSRPRARAMGVGGGLLAALLVWTVAGSVVGVDLQVTAGTDQPRPVDVNSVIVASLAAGLAGWASVALLERLTHRARPLWVGLALVVLVLSLAPTQAGVTAATTAALSVMHLAVAGVVLPVLAITSPQVGVDRHGTD